VTEPSEPHWSETVEQAAWIADRLSDFGTTVSSIVPSGFEAYARLLHPAETPHSGDGNLVRWSEVAAWSGLPLRSGSQFHSIALPMINPGSPAPWKGQGPQQGTLYPPDAAVLAELLRPLTSTPEQCWFGLWDGYGWENASLMTSEGGSSVLPDPVPGSVRNDPRIHLPNRDYLLYSGPVEAARESVHLTDWGQTPNLWWPEDRAWFVASEIDLAWTHVGGSAGMVEALVSDSRIEALPVEPTDVHWFVEDWLQEMVAEAVNELLMSGTTTITTFRGTVTATYQAPRKLRAGELRISTVYPDGRGFGTTPLRSDDPETIRTSLSFQLTGAVIQLVGG
jgi:hypothetical protein